MSDASLQLYQTWIGEVARLREMRHQHTQFNTSLNLAVAGGLSFFINEPNQWYFSVWIAVGMLIANLSWMNTDGWFAHETKRKFEQLIELEQSIAPKFITRDSEVVWRKTHFFRWLTGVEIVLPRLFFVTFLAIALKDSWPHLTALAKWAGWLQ